MFKPKNIRFILLGLSVVLIGVLGYIIYRQNSQISASTENPNSGKNANLAITSIVAGGQQTIALRSDGTVWRAGQFGIESTNNATTLQRITELSNIKKIAAGTNHALALMLNSGQQSGAVYAWGANNRGQLGIGNNLPYTNPIRAISINSVKKIGAGGSHSLADKGPYGNTYTWGAGTEGQLGNGSLADNYSATLTSPIDLPTTDNSTTALTGGLNFSLVLGQDGIIRSWGQNRVGQLGDGTNTDHSTFVHVLNLTDVKAIASGEWHSLALKSDGTVWSWGMNRRGQLGNGTINDSNVPVQVQNLTDVIAIAGGQFNSIALKSDGTMYTWGDNKYGQLGDGTTTNQTTPVKVPELSKITAIASGSNHALALRQDGSLWAWGANNFGQLANGSLDNSLVPIRATKIR